MPEPDEDAGEEPLDLDLGEIDDLSYLLAVEPLFGEWTSAADAAAYDGLADQSQPLRTHAVIPGLTRDPS